MSHVTGGITILQEALVAAARVGYKDEGGARATASLISRGVDLAGETALGAPLAQRLRTDARQLETFAGRLYDPMLGGERGIQDTLRAANKDVVAALLHLEPARGHSGTKLFEEALGSAARVGHMDERGARATANLVQRGVELAGDASLGAPLAQRLRDDAAELHRFANLTYNPMLGAGTGIPSTVRNLETGVVEALRHTAPS